MLQVLLVMAVAATTPANADKAQNTVPEGQEVTVTPEAGAKRAPSEVVCVRQQEIGSRLKARKVCKTRAEWDAEKREQRQAVDKAQGSRWKSN